MDMLENMGNYMIVNGVIKEGQKGEEGKEVDNMRKRKEFLEESKRNCV